MRSKPISVARLAMLVGFAFAYAAPAAPPGLVLSVDSVKKEIREAGKSGTVRGLSFDVRIQSPMTNAVNCTLEWYFVASLVEGFGYYISDQGSREITITPRGVATATRESPMSLKAKVRQKNGKTADEQAEIKGFIVRVLVGSEVVATHGEPPFIARKMDDPDVFQDLLSAEPAKLAKPAKTP